MAIVDRLFQTFGNCRTRIIKIYKGKMRGKEGASLAFSLFAPLHAILTVKGDGRMTVENNPYYSLTLAAEVDGGRFVIWS